MTKQWLAERWKDFLPAIEALGCEQEAEIQRMCEAELAEWRARPQMKQERSLRTPLTETRNKMKKFAVSPLNCWLNPRTGKPEHLALKYLNFTDEQWAALNAPSEEKLQQRLEDVQFLRDPEGIVAVAEKLLKSDQWDELVVGLATVTGRRLTEVLKVGVFLPKTRYTIIFGGQLKRKDKVLDPYEIPTLVEASLVLKAWQRLRQLQDCTHMDSDRISKELGPVVSATANQYYRTLVPLRSGKDDLYTHLFRTIYARIAVLFYAPDYIADITYMSHIQGHYWALNAKSEQVKHDYVATLHYNDYRIGLKEGGIDGRQGIKLDQPGVVILERFQREAPGEERLATEKGLGLKMSDNNKTGFSTMRPKVQTKNLLDEEQKRLKIKSNDELLLELLRRSHLYELQQEQLGTSESSGLGEFLQEVTALPLKVDVVTYLRGLVKTDSKFRAGLEKRHKGINYEKLSMEKLEGIKTAEAATERFRRAVDAILYYNDSVDEPLKRWYIDVVRVRMLVGGRHPVAKEYLESRKSEIDAHHQKYELTPAYNNKPYSIQSVIHLFNESDGDATPIDADESEAPAEDNVSV